MCQNKYRSTSDRTVKPKGVFELDSTTTTTTILANVNKVQTLRCDFYEQWNTNGNCVPEGYIEEAYYDGNFHKGNPYYNTYNEDWHDHLNVIWCNNQGAPQIPQAQQQGISSQLEEALDQFMKSTQLSFEKVGKNQESMFKNQLEMTKNQDTIGNDQLESLHKKLRNSNWSIVSMNGSTR